MDVWHKVDYAMKKPETEAEEAVLCGADMEGCGECLMRGDGADRRL